MASTGTVIEDAFRPWVEAFEECAEAGLKLYPPNLVPQSSAKPYGVLSRTPHGRGQRLRTLAGPCGVSHVRLQLDLYHRDYAALRRLAQAVIETADGFCGTMGGRTVQDITVHDDFDNTLGDIDNEPAHGDSVTESRYTIDLTIWFQE